MATPAWVSLACQMSLLLLFGMSAHAAKNSLAPAEPMLHTLGVSPVAYACVSAVPQIGCIVLPTLWGAAYRGHEKLVLSSVPCGMFLGQLLILCSFISLEQKSLDDISESGIPEMALCLGFVVFSVFHGGAHVVQCTVLTRVLPRGLTSGFVGTIAATHIIVAACNFTVPWAWDHGGIVGVQLLLLIPAVVSMLAGLVLAWLSVNFAVPHEPKCQQLPGGLSDGLLNTTSVKEPPDLEIPTLWRRTGAQMQSLCLPPDANFLYWLSLWKALEVGSLHSLRTIKNALVVGFGQTASEAGILLGAYQTIAILISYGLFESSFSLAQVILTFAAGYMRKAGGTHYAMSLFTFTFTAGSFTACHLAKQIH